MEYEFAKRLNDFGEGIFSVLNEKKEELIRSGKKVYNLSVGTPDFKPAPHVMQALTEAAKLPENYKYSLKDLPALTEAVIGRYKKRYQVDLTEEEVMSVYGSQEGITHLPLVLCDPGDVVLVPNPGYPIFRIAPALMGAEPIEYPLVKENGFLPDLEGIPFDVRKKAKYMVVSYPANPLCAVAPVEFYEKLIAFAKENNIIIVHDNAYSDIIFDGKKGISFLSLPGAKEVGVEFYSLSKSFNLTGARVSFLVGNKNIVQAYRAVRSQIDYGMFLPVQYAAIAALTGPEDFILKQCLEYQKRRDALCGGFRRIGWEVPDSKGSMFVWAPIPKGFQNSEEFVMELMKKTGVLCTPGSSFGSYGEGYVRMALVLPVPELLEAVEAVRKSGIFSTR